MLCQNTIERLDRVLAQPRLLLRTSYSESSKSILSNCIPKGDDALILAMRSPKTSTLHRFAMLLRFPCCSAFDSNSKNPQSELVITKVCNRFVQLERELSVGGCW